MKFFISLFFISTVALGQGDQELLRYRDSYQHTYQACQSENFKLDIFHQSYVAGMGNVLKLVSMAPSKFSEFIFTQGISPFLDDLIYSEAKLLALEDCLGKKSKEGLIKSLFLADLLGKVVGVSIIVPGAKALSLALKPIQGTLAHFMGAWGAKLGVSAAALSTLHFLFQDYQKIHDIDEAKIDAELEKALGYREMKEDAWEHMLEIEEKLSNHDLPSTQKERLEREYRNWKKIYEFAS